MRPLALLLVTLAACASAPPKPEASWQDPRPTDEAERLALIGDLPGARASAERLLAKAPTDGPPLFLAACIALRQGDLAAADGYAKRLARLDPVPAEAPVLTALVARRRVKPAEPIHEALVAAWGEAGIPEPRPNVQLLPLMWTRATSHDLFGLDRAALAKLPPGEAWLIEASATWPGPFWTEGPRVQDLERRAGENGLLVNLSLLGSPGAADKVGLLRALAAARPDDGLFALALAAQREPGESIPYSPPEVQALEAAASATRAGLSTEEWQALEDDFARKATTALRRGARTVSRIAVTHAATALALRFFVTWKRGEATTGPERERAARALLRIGSRLVGSPVRLEAMMGSAMETWGATALGDERALARAQERRRRLEREISSEPRMPNSWDWPLASLDDDLGPLR